MDVKEIKDIVNDEIKSFINNRLDIEIQKLLKDKNSKSREEVINSIKNAFDSVYKVFWQKKDFWKDAIK